MQKPTHRLSRAKCMIFCTASGLQVLGPYKFVVITTPCWPLSVPITKCHHSTYRILLSLMRCLIVLLSECFQSGSHAFMPTDVWLCLPVWMRVQDRLNRSMYLCTSTAHDYILFMLALLSAIYMYMYMSRGVGRLFVHLMCASHGCWHAN